MGSDSGGNQRPEMLLDGWVCTAINSKFIKYEKMSFRPKYGITEQRNGYRGTMRLIVRNFSPSDVGTYHCVSTNSLGKAEGTLRLYGEWKFTSFFSVSPLTIDRIAEGLPKNGLYGGWERDGREQDKDIAQSFLSSIFHLIVHGLFKFK